MRWKLLTFILSLVVIFLGIMLMTTGCGEKTNSDRQVFTVQAKDTTFNMEFESIDFAVGVDNFYLYRDVQTGVEYIVVITGNGVAITPRYEDSMNLVIKKD